jgi:hypothetical protein
VGDYRDDRGALRQRIEELESELERAQRAKAELETELQRETLAYRAVTSTDASPTVIEAALVGPRKVELRLTTETAPPSSLTPKKTRLLVACDNHHMVLAFGERAVAWNRATGDAMWIATLPAAVGGIEPGPFELECETLRITAGTISLKHGVPLRGIEDTELLPSPSDARAVGGEVASVEREYRRCPKRLRGGH